MTRRPPRDLRNLGALALVLLALWTVLVLWLTFSAH
jgi:hypothetical protein